MKQDKKRMSVNRMKQDKKRMLVHVNRMIVLATGIKCKKMSHLDRAIASSDPTICQRANVQDRHPIHVEEAWLVSMS